MTNFRSLNVGDVVSSISAISPGIKLVGGAIIGIGAMPAISPAGDTFLASNVFFGEPEAYQVKPHPNSVELGSALNGWAFSASSSKSSTVGAVDEVAATAAKGQLTGSLLSALRRNPVEEGFVSEADGILARALADNRLQTLEWVSDLFVANAERPQIASGLLMLVGRVDAETVGAMGMTMALAGIGHKSPLVQEAAIRALEAWGGEQSLQILQNFHLATPWLQQYVEAVKRDLMADA